MRIEEITNRIKMIDKIKQQKEAIKQGLEIVWETDPKKMQFDKLRSYQMVKNNDREVLRVEDFDITQSGRYDIFVGENQSYIEMMDILIAGGKLIPPMATEGYAIVDGEEKMVRPFSGLSDGFHRVNFARYFGLDTVPVVVFKTFIGYWFTPERWIFEADNGIKATLIDGRVIKINDYGSLIDDSNTDYLVIQTRN